MARSPLEVAIASDTKAFQQGVETGIIVPLEDAIKKLKDLGDADGAEQLEKALKSAQRQTAQLADESARTAREIDQKYRDAYRSMKQEATESLDGLSGASREVGAELTQNIGETFSSFRGDAEDFAQIVQDTLGGLAGSLGGLPAIAATAAGAAGLGLIIGAFQSAQEEQEKLSEKAGEWAAKYIEAGSTVLSVSQQVAEIQDIWTNQYDVLVANAKKWGVSNEVAANAMAGIPGALDQVSESIGKMRDAYDAGALDRTKDMNSTLDKQKKALDEAQSAYDAIAGAMSRGAEQASGASASLVALAENTQGATKTVDEFGDRIYALPGDVKVYVDAQTGQATTDLDAIDKKIYSTNGKVAWLDVRVNDEAVKNWRPPMLDPIQLRFQADISGLKSATWGP